jgi:SecD/SecF fusion protein
VKREGRWLSFILVLVALSIFVVCNPKKPLRLGLDIQGGVRAVLQAVLPEGQKLTPDQRKTLLDIITRRVNSTGVAEPTVQPKGDSDQFIVELPNATNKDDLIKEIGTTAQMEIRYFAPVQSETFRNAPYQMDRTKDATGKESYNFVNTTDRTAFRDKGQIEDDFSNLIKNSSERPGAALYKPTGLLAPLAPSDHSIYFDADQIKKVESLETELGEFNKFLAQCPLVVNGSEMGSQSKAELDPTQGPVVTFSVKPEAVNKFAEFTEVHNKEYMGILLDGRVISAPVNSTPITGGEGEISGGFANIKEAQSLADLINAGALPVPMDIVQNNSVDATLGAQALHKMFLAGALGLGLVLFFMAAYYMLPGLVADVALIFYTLFSIAVYKGGLSWFIPAVTMTLPGVAGFILSVGMAVDANILIFERMKEELRNGKHLRQAIDAGFTRAFSAIRDSNICTIITCTILYSMGTPTVKGFALTLGIGVLISLFTAITATRSMLYLLVDAGAEKRPELFGLNRQWFGGARPNDTLANAKRPLHIVEKRVWFYGLSCLVIIPGVIFLCMGGLKKGIEFTGGTQVEILFAKPISQSAVANALNAAGLKENQVQLADGGKTAIITVRNLGDEKGEGSKKVSQALSNPFIGRAEAAPATSNGAAPNAPTSPVKAASTPPIAGSASPATKTNIAAKVPEPASSETTAPTAPSAATAPAVDPTSAAGSGNADTGYLKIAFKKGPGEVAPIGSPVEHPAIDSLGVPYTMESHSLVKGIISEELTRNAFEAVAIASCLIVLYLALAFIKIGGFVAGLRFGASAIAALLHDVLVLVGSFAILGYFLNWEIDTLFITATLTVVGFSVHDTIVIFDRIRENLIHHLKGESFEDLANRSILQSFARSINTSFTVILTLLMMLIFGDSSTRLMVVALLIGIVSGTYSSIFNATPILVDWEAYLSRHRSSYQAIHTAAAESAAIPAPKAPEVPETPNLPSQVSTVAPAPGQRSAKPKRGGAPRRF